MADPAASLERIIAPAQVVVSAVDDALLTLLAKRLARALLLEEKADIAAGAAHPRVDSAERDSHF